MDAIISKNIIVLLRALYIAISLIYFYAPIRAQSESQVIAKNNIKENKKKTQERRANKRRSSKWQRVRSTVRSAGTCIRDHGRACAAITAGIGLYLFSGKLPTIVSLASSTGVGKSGSRPTDPSGSPVPGSDWETYSSSNEKPQKQLFLLGQLQGVRATHLDNPFKQACWQSLSEQEKKGVAWGAAQRMSFMADDMNMPAALEQSHGWCGEAANQDTWESCWNTIKAAKHDQDLLDTYRIACDQKLMDTGLALSDLRGIYKEIENGDEGSQGWLWFTNAVDNAPNKRLKILGNRAQRLHKDKAREVGKPDPGAQAI